MPGFGELDVENCHYWMLAKQVDEALAGMHAGELAFLHVTST